MRDIARQIAELPPEKRALLELLLQKEGVDLSRSLIIPQKRDTNAFPLSFAQRRLWFLDQLEPNSPLYNIASAVRLTGALNVTALEQSLNQIVRRHESLRTTFVAKDGHPVQVIAPELTVPLPVVDLHSLSEAEREAEALQLAIEEAQRPFDLAKGPLLRTTLLRLDEEDHILLLTMHHIISDGWSMGVFVREMGALYEALSQGRPSPLPELPIQYVDFAQWQRKWLQGEELERQLAYWKEQLAGLPPLLELPTDRPRPAVQRYQGAHHSFALSKSLSQALESLSQEEGATLFMTLLAAFQTLLYRYTGQEDICVGTPIANRTRAEIEGLIGFFVNTLVLRTDLSGDPSFRELLRRVREVALGAYAHQDLPFEMLVDELQPARDMSHSPLFQVMFVLQNAPVQALELSELTLSPVETENGIAKFDLTLMMEERPEGLQGTVEYNTDLFDAATIERMVGHFQTLLEGIVADPDRPISTLPLLTAAEREQLLVGWNDTEAEYPGDKCVHQWFEAQVEQTPEAIAVAFGEEEQLTYGELNRRANQLAHYLQKLGVGPETLVGLCVDRSPEMVIGLLGVLKAGGAYLPLDPTYPQERLAFMLEDAGISIILTQSHLLDRLGVQRKDVKRNPQSAIGNRQFTICLDTDWEVIAREPDTNPVSAVTPDNLAYVIYTSGSTGRPKGTLLQHRGLSNFAHAYIRRLSLGPGSRLLQFASFSFDASLAEIFTTLLSGATLRLARRDILMSVSDLHRLLREGEITIAILPPSILSVLPTEGLSALQTLISAGESCSREIAESWAPGRRLFNGYGPTEATIGPTLYPIESVPEGVASVPIGRPITNTQVYLLDAHLQPVPVGVSGELYIGGVGLARGYLNRPELTAERFIPNPFSDEPGARLYRTGDLARYLPDGNIEFLGRIDHQVKVRGFRIELGEIEAVLRQHPHLQAAVVLAREDTPGDKRLVAYVVPREEPAPTISELRRFLKETLPEYMVPSAFVYLDALPLTPNGKVDRRALPAPDQTRPELESAYVAPRTREEKILADIWAQVLGVEQVGVHDNFFELGGDSILSIQVIARANQAGLQLTPRQLFQAPTVAGLAAMAGTGRAIEAEQGIVEGPVPLTPIQHWFFEQELPEPHHWNQALLLEVRQALEPSLLEGAVEHLMAHHDALRLRFTPPAPPESGKEKGGGEWRQVNVGMDGEVPFICVDLSALPSAEQGPAIEVAAAEAQTSLNLTTGPLLRVVYFDLGAGQPGRLLIVIHHLAVDGVSWRILLEDLQMAYHQLSRGEAVQLPPKTTSFQQWARRLVEYAQTEAVRRELDYWLGILAPDRSRTRLEQGSLSAEHRIARLPVDYPGGENTEASARTVAVSLSAEETQALLQEVPAAYRTEINDVLLTALAQAMARWTGSRALLVELEGHGREPIFDDVDLTRTVGWFTVAFPVVLDLKNADGPGEALKAVKEQLRRVPHRGLGYGLLRYLCQDEEVTKQLQALPQPEIGFNYMGQLDQALPGGSPFGPARESRGPDRSPQGRRNHLLDISGSIAGGQLRLEWIYSENLYRRATVEQMAQDFLEALRAIIAHCRSPEAGDVTPSDFPLAGLDQKKLKKVLAKLKK